jgi:Putative DNA-binding domain/AAA domain
MSYAVNRVDLTTFVGRAATLRAIERRHHEGRSWILRAGRRMGKTMLLRRYAEDSANPVAYVDCQSVPAEASPTEFFARVILSRAESSAGPLATFHQLSDIETAIRTSEKSHLILLDEPDVLLRQSWGVGVLENLRYLVSNSTAAGKVSVGLAGGFHLASRLTTAGSPIANVCEEVGLEPLVQHDVSDLAKRGFSRKDSESVAHDVWASGGGHPFLVQALLLEFKRKGWPLKVADHTHLTSVVEPQVRRWVEDVNLTVEDSLAGHGMGARRTQELLSSGLFRKEDKALVPNGAWCAAVLDAITNADRLEDKGISGSLSLEEALDRGEGQQVEFKASLRWDHSTGMISKAIEGEVVRAVAGMMNAKGGVVVVGVNDDATVGGIKSDLRTVQRKNLDGWELRLRTVLSESLERHLVPHIDVKFETVDDKHVALVHVPPVTEPVFLEVDHRRVLPVRSGNGTMMLDAADAYEYLRHRRELP